MDLLSNSYLKKITLDAGFTYCGIAPVVDFSDEKKLFQDSIESGFHGNMSYLERNIAERFDIRTILPTCKSVVVVLFNYNTGKTLQSSYRISRYAFVRDYHHLMKEKLEEVVEKMKEKNGDFQYKISVDSGRISEKNWAVKSGVGHYGKNGLLITPSGSFYFIGILLLDQEMDQYDEPHDSDKDSCGTCQRCLEMCPTKAIIKPYVIDARKCLSYQTLSNKTPDFELIKEHSWIYGCDICQEVCPKNKKSTISELAIANSSLFLHFQDSDFENLTKEVFEAYFSNTSIGSKGYAKMIQFIKNRQQ